MKPLRVMIVDDSGLNRLALKSFFSQLGHEIVEMADSVEDAKTKFAQVLPDLITIDQVMPGQSGINLAKYVNDFDKEHERKTKIFFITSDPLRESAKSMVKVDEFILKPATKVKIAKALDKVL